jgi:predicted metal-dependent phosphoesterase TrpH
MHTHSFWSDGDDFPEAIAKWYRDRGYQFLVFTDHNTLLQKERWVNLDKRKAAYESLAAAWPAEWIDTR